MRTLHLFLITIFICASGLPKAAAQSVKAKLKTAKYYQEILNYQGAIETYESIFNKKDFTEVPDAVFGLAESYRKVSDPENAEYWYAYAVQLPEAESKPEIYLWYGYMLLRNGKCTEAEPWFQKYVELRPDDTRGRHLLRACEYHDEFMTKNAGIYDVEHMPFNSGLDDFGPMYFGDGIVYASENYQSNLTKRVHCWTGNQFLDLRYVNRDSTGEDDSGGTCGSYDYGQPDNFSKELNTKFHDATPTFNEDQSTIYFTRNNLEKGRARKDDEGVIRLKIYSAESRGSGGNASFSKVEGLPFNSDEYSVAHPALSPDGKFLYFASDMPGGFGGMDLYVSEEEDGRWGPPLNLGPKINTEGQEVFPYAAHDGKLYFSSDGQVGLGGLDIFYMEKKEGFNEWSEITNIGYPINSNSDDFGLIMDKNNKHGYFTSDRDGGFGDDDIYSFCRNASELEVLVYDEKTGDPIEGAEVVSDCTGATALTDVEGKAKFLQKDGQCCDFAASKEDYEDNNKEGCTQPGEKNIVEIPLRKPKPCELRGVVSQAGTPMPGKTVTLDNDCGKETFFYTTEADGSYYFKLTPGCNYTARVTPPAGFTGPNEKTLSLEDEGNLGECQFVKDFPFAPTVASGNPGGNPGANISGYDRNGNPIYGSDPGSSSYIDPRTGQPVPRNPSVDGRWTIDQIQAEAGRNDPINCCSVFDGLETSAGFIGISPSVVNYQEGDPIPYLLHIYYDFDQSYIRDDAEPELRKVLALMNENPNITVEIGSHTDSRGSQSYNNRLSQRRAESVVRWLKDNGVSASRLSAQGYGEGVNINNCTNNVPCSEAEHQLNRRTEFRVVGLTDGTQFSKSTARTNVQGVGCEGCPF